MQHLVALVVGALALGPAVPIDEGGYSFLGTGKDDPAAAPIIEAFETSSQHYSEKDWTDLRNLMTDEAKAVVSRKVLRAQCRQMQSICGVPESFEILEIHNLDASESIKKVPAGKPHFVDIETNLLSGPHQMVPPPSGRCAIVISRTKPKKGSDCWFSVVLEPVDGTWKLFALHVGPMFAKGKDGAWYLDRAAEQREAGQHRNAYLYTQIANHLLGVSGSIAPASTNERVKQIHPLKMPNNLPYPGLRSEETWEIAEGEELVVNYVSYATFPQAISLEVRFFSKHEDMSTEAAQSERKRLFEYITEAFPEYAEAFDSVFIGSTNPSGRGFRERFEFERPESDK